MPITNIGTSPVIPYQAGTPQEGPAYFVFAIVLPANQISISQSKPFPVGMSQVLSVLVDNRTNTFDITVSFAGGSNFQVGRGQSTIVPVFAPASAKTLDVDLSVTAAQSTPSVVVFQAFNTREDLAIFGQQQATISDQTRVLGSRIVNPVMFTNIRRLTHKLSTPLGTLISQTVSLATTYAPIKNTNIANPSRIFDIAILNQTTNKVIISLTGASDGSGDAYILNGTGNISLSTNNYIGGTYYIKGGTTFNVNIVYAIIPDFTLSGSAVFNIPSVFGSHSLFADAVVTNTNGFPPIFSDVWTIEGWLRYPPSNFTTGVNVLTLGNSMNMKLNNVGNIVVQFYKWDGSVELNITSNFLFKDSNFHHFAIVSDGYRLKLFIDGSIDSAFDFPIYLGDYGTIQVGDLISKAWLDELAFWQIPKYFNNFSSGQVGAPFSANMAGLAALWHFDDNLFDSGPGAFAYI